MSNWWDGLGGAPNQVYVVQTNVELVKRCILMTTDPGDLVLDPTCGSGTTAYVAEQWGRRWITIDTSRVAFALARSRLMGARYPYYLLVDSREGQMKEAAVTHSVPKTAPTCGDIRHGFVYERARSGTSGAIANNAEIDVIWEKWQETLEPLRATLNTSLGNSWEEWEIPREAAPGWHAEAKKRARRVVEGAHRTTESDRRLDHGQRRVRVSLRQAVRRPEQGPGRRAVHRREPVAAPGDPERRIRRG